MAVALDKLVEIHQVFDGALANGLGVAHLDAALLGIGDELQAARGLLVVEAGGVGADVRIDAFGFHYQVIAGALGAGGAAAGGGCQRGIVEREGGVLEVDGEGAGEVVLGGAVGHRLAVVAFDHALERFLLQRGRDARDEQRGRGLELAAEEFLARVAAEGEQLEAGVDVAAALADLGGDLVGLVAVAHQRLVAFGLFDGMHVAALQVLDDLDLEHLLVVEFAPEGGEAFEAGCLGSAPATLSDDDLIDGPLIVWMGALVEGEQRVERERPDGNGLDQAVAFDRVGQFGDIGIIDVLARIAGRGDDGGDGQFGHGDGIGRDWGVHAVFS